MSDHRVVIVAQPCPHGFTNRHLLSLEDWTQLPPTLRWCETGTSRVLEPGSYVLIEKDAGTVHDVVAAAIVEYEHGDTLESSCELADAALIWIVTGKRRR